VDSAIFVLGMFTDQGNTEPNKRYRLFWGVSIALFTVVVILLGKDSLLQSVSQLLILFALPFSFLFLGMVLSFIYQLNKSSNKS
jgi:glycine betaine transporter